MKSVSLSMDDHLNGVVTSLCTCWKITRSDGEILGFTDHDQSFTHSGVLYKASSGYYRTAISNSADSSVDNLDVSGFLDDDSLSEDELRNGAYDYAQVEVFAVNWQDLTQGIVRLRYGYFGEVMIVSSGFFKVELRGLTQLFSVTIGDTYSPECRADLGDSLCKVPLVPATRRSGANVKLGDRVIVPQVPGANLTLKVLNPGFEYLTSYPTDSRWSGADRRIWNGPAPVDDFAAADAFFIAPLTATGVTTFSRTRNQVGTAAGRLSFEADTKAVDISTMPRIKLRMFWGSSGGVPAPDVGPNVYDVSTPWFNLPVGDGTVSIPVEDFVPAAPASTSAGAVFFWQIIWEGMPTDALVTKNIEINPYPMILGVVPNQASLTPSGLPMSNATAWQYSSWAQTVGPNIWMSPMTGDWMLELFPGPDGTESAWQDIYFDSDITEFLPLIDDDTPMKLRISGFNGAETVAVENYARYYFYNGADALIEMVTQEPQYMYGRGYWGPFDYTADVPQLTRRVRIELITHNTSKNARARAVWDNISLRMYEQSYEDQDNYLAYGKVEFSCTQAGVTDSSIPTFDYTLGVVTADGTAQWTAVLPLHMFTLPITEVISHKQIRLAGLDKPNDWFEWGVIEVLQGKNIKKKMEVAAWDNVTKIATLALPLPYLPIVGENIRIHTGCAKSRAVCDSKFNNIVNYRGEPDLPGTDQYFKIGGANVGNTALGGNK